MLVSEGDDVNDVATNLIENAERKASYENAAAMVKRCNAYFRVFNGHCQNTFHFSDQFLSQFWCIGIVEKRCCKELFTRLR